MFHVLWVYVHSEQTKHCLEILENEGNIGHSEAATIAKKANEIFDVTKIQAGKIIKLFFAGEAFAQSTYDIDIWTDLRNPFSTISYPDSHLATKIRQLHI